MIIDEGVYLEHYGKKGMKWGTTRKDDKAAKKALSPKGHSDRFKRNEKRQNQVRQDRVSNQVEVMVARALAEPMSNVTISSKDRTLVVNGRDFAEVVVGRVDNAHIGPYTPPIHETRR